MLNRSWIIAAAALIGLTGCLGLDNDAERALAGAGAGCVAGEVLDNDCTTGALVGGLAGALANDI